MAQSARGGLDFGRAKPADPSARARARARARYLKKRAASFSTRESLGQKFGNLLLMCAQWTNLGGVIFQFFENCLENIEQILEPGGSQEEVRRKSRGSQEEVKRKSRGSQEEDIPDQPIYGGGRGWLGLGKIPKCENLGVKSSKRRQVICCFCATLPLGNILDRKSVV